MEVDQVEDPGPSYDNDNEWEPRHGMEFETEEEAYIFYNNYGRRKGFSVRRSWCQISKDKVLKNRRFCCSKEGYREPDKRRDYVQNPRPVTRTGCMAQMFIVLQPNGKYQVTKFQLSHNHELVTPEKAHLLRSQRRMAKVQAAQMIQVEKLSSAQGALYEVQIGRGGGCAGFLQMACNNRLPNKREKAMEIGAAGAAMEYFKVMQIQKKSFFYSMQLDADDKITNIFWADTRSIIDYNHFGDVVCFDTTYQTSNRERPFIPILGVNHHCQIIVFGGVLLYDRTVDSWVWLLETFIQAMSGKKPRTILTNQSPVVAEAIARVMPETHHRLCIWHMYQNAIKHLSYVFGGAPSFSVDFKRCISDCEEEEPFLQAWNDLLEKYQLRNNVWLQELFKEREKWALVYGRHVFCANMINLQLCESFNTLLRRTLNSKLNIVQFFGHFEKLLEDQRYNELQEDFKMADSVPLLYVPLPMLKQTSNEYTPTMFQLFQNEHKTSLCTYAYPLEEVGGVSKFKVVNEGGNPNGHSVVFDSQADTIQCSCHKFEFLGIQCSHVLKVLDRHNIKLLPSQYMLKRWTKMAKLGSVRHDQGMRVKPQDGTKGRFLALYHNFEKLAARAAQSKEAYEFVSHTSVKLMDDVEEMLRNVPPDGPSVETQSKTVRDELCSSDNDEDTAGSSSGPRGMAKKRKLVHEGCMTSQTGHSLEHHSNKKQSQSESPFSDSAATYSPYEHPQNSSQISSGLVELQLAQLLQATTTPNCHYSQTKSNGREDLNF